MTVNELRNRLAKQDGNADVLILWEDGDKQHLLDVDDVSLGRGVPNTQSGKKIIKWDPEGPASYVFVSVSEA